MTYVLSDYVSLALADAAYDKLEDRSYAGRIPSCQGVVAFGTSLRSCENELRSTLEDWILLGLRLGHKLPVIGGIDLNMGSRSAGHDAATLQDVERKAIVEALQAVGGDRVRAAKLLGIGKTTIYRKLKGYGSW